MIICGDGRNFWDSLNENLVQSIQKLRLGRRFTFQQDHDPKHTVRVAYRQPCKCPWVAQPQPGLDSQSNISGETLICLSAPIQAGRAWEVKRGGEEWQIIARCRCAKLVTSYPKRLEAVKLFQLSAELRVWILMQCTYFSVLFLIKLQSCHKFILCFVIMVNEMYWCGKNYRLQHKIWKQ